MSIYDTPEFLSDALDDLRADYLAQIKPAPVPPVRGSGLNGPMRLVLAHTRRLLGVGDPATCGGLGLDLGFLLACDELAPDLFGDLVAWRMGSPSLAREHATGARQRVEQDQVAAARARRHREYKDGLRTRPLPEAM